MAMLCGGALPLDATDLKHLWDFEGEQWRLDKVGMAHGTGTPETTLGISAGAGGVGRALAVGGEISGADDHLVVDAAELYQPGISPFSVAFWIRMPGDGTVAITWLALVGEVLAVWSSSELEAWSELNDSVVAGADGGRYEYDVPDPQHERMFLQVRRSE